jgi:outer membrane receptor protein involved in Fe transport
LDENSTSWVTGANFKATDNTLLYANISKGFKAGSVPHVSGAVFDAYAPVKQESILAYELGTKTEFLNNILTVDAAAFYYDYKNKQTRAKFVDPVFGALDRLLNVPKSTIKGAEFEITARPFMGVRLTASATYLDAKVKQYTGAIGQERVGGLLLPVNASFDGVRLPFAPELQYSVRGDYLFPLSGSLQGFFGIGVNGQTNSVSTLVKPGSVTFGASAGLYDINPYALVNLNLGIEDTNNRWRASIWGKNVFDKYYWSNATQTYDDFVRYTGRPAEFGITVSYQY